MSTSAPSAARGQAGELAGPILVLLALAAGAWFFLLRDDETPLDRSAMGSDGLVRWLNAEGIEARYPTPVPVVDPEVGLRIIPVLDTDLSTIFERPETREEYLATGTERDLTAGVLRTKIERLPSLVILPKWTRAARHSGYAHRSLLLDDATASGALRTLALYRGNLVRTGPDVTRIRTSWGEATLYAAQLFPATLGSGCSSVIAAGEGHLLIRCERDGKRPFHALSDPDLLNNHGLALGENAAVAAGLVRELAAGRPVWIDVSDRVFVEEERPPLQTRSWAEIARFFAYPFNMLWLGAAALLVLALWRSWRRFGPPRKVFDDSIRASRDVAIAAKARLLRRSGNDQRLFETHVRARLRALSAEVLGPGRPAADPVRAITERLKPRAPDLASAFAGAAAAATTVTPGTPPHRMLDILTEFEIQAERVLHELGRI